MKTFSLDNEYQVRCNWKETKTGFKHTATLYKNGFLRYNTEIHYLNRTWEVFEFESILKKVADNYFNDNENLRSKYIKIIKEDLI